MPKLTALVALSRAAVIGAVPDVIVDPLKAECLSYPGYQKNSGDAGPWTIFADSTGTAIDEATGAAAFATGNTSVAWGYVSSVRQRSQAPHARACRLIR